MSLLLEKTVCVLVGLTKSLQVKFKKSPKREKAPGLLAICPSGLDVPAQSVPAPPLSLN